MSVSMESSDGLLRHVLVGGFISSSRGTETDNYEERHRTTHSTPSLISTPPLFSLPTFSPLILNHRSSPLSATSDTPSPITRARGHSQTSLSSPFSSPHKRTNSPILNLAKIDEKTLLKTSLHPEAPEHAMNSNMPGIFISSAASPDDRDFTRTNQSFECYDLRQLSTRADVPLRLRSLSLTPVLNSSGQITSPENGPHKRYLKFRRSDIKFGKMIGKGGFGIVYEGSIAGSPIAIKIVQKRRGSGIHREILQAERLAFKLNLRHENIVGIYGVNLCEELRGDALILMELVTSQSLQALIEDTTRVIKVNERLGCALQVANGLSYLHDHNVVHLDVKPANVLLTSDYVCKLSDFGNLTLTGPHVRQEEPDFTQLLGTLPYRAPELMRGLFPSTKADIYSFGITFWQMLTRESPHKNINPHALIYQVVTSSIRPSIPEIGNDVTENLYMELYTSCWSQDVDARPSAKEIIVTVQSIMEQSSS